MTSDNKLLSSVSQSFSRSGCMLSARLHFVSVIFDLS